MITYDPKAWFTLIFRWHGSVVPGIFFELVLAVAVGFLAYWMAAQGIDMRAVVNFLGVSSDSDGEVLDDGVHQLMVVPLGFLLIFRSNNAYNRYWEGRTFVGVIVRSCREMTRLIASYCEGDDEAAQIERAELRRLVNMLYAVVRQHLEVPDPRLRDLGHRDMHMVTPNEARVLQGPKNSVKNRVSIVAQWFSFRVNESYRAGRLRKEDVWLIEARLTELIGAWMGCARIIATPLPFPYVQMLNVLLLLFVYTAPFTFANRFGGFTPIMAVLLAFALLGINAVAGEIENPFGSDANDLPLGEFGKAVEEDSELILRQRDPDTEKYEKFWGKRSLHQRLLREAPDIDTPHTAAEAASRKSAVGPSPWLSGWSRQAVCGGRRKSRGLSLGRMSVTGSKVSARANKHCGEDSSTAAAAPAASETGTGQIRILES